jgi:hypothetical protein
LLHDGEPCNLRRIPRGSGDGRPPIPFLGARFAQAVSLRWGPRETPGSVRERAPVPVRKRRPLLVPSGRAAHQRSDARTRAEAGAWRPAFRALRGRRGRGRDARVVAEAGVRLPIHDRSCAGAYQLGT